ncbi:MAG: ATP-binding protein [Isosphaeraceae bacterium]
MFARLDESDLAEFDLNDNVRTTVTIILGHAKRKRVVIEMDLQPVPPITGYVAKINQVVMNLISNAIDACQEGGKVIVRTRPDRDRYAVRLDVIDDGCGIDPSILPRIFDPFFTTKPVGVGTGLGLSISYGILQDHGGLIEADSRPGQGARFTIRLPLKCRARASSAGELEHEHEAETPALY